MVETGAGQHGAATATAAALLGMECDIYGYCGWNGSVRMCSHEFQDQVIPAEGGKTLKDAVNEALRDWTKTVRDTHYVVRLSAPLPTIVRSFNGIGTKPAADSGIRRQAA